MTRSPVATAATSRLNAVRWRRWSELDRVERVDVYTRGSLLVALWGVCGSLVLAAIVGRAGDLAADDAVLLAVGGLVVTTLGSTALRRMIDLYPATGPLPWRWLLPLLGIAVAYVAVIGLAVGGDEVGVALVVAVANVAAAFGGIADRRATVALVAGSGLVVGVGTLDPRPGVAIAITTAAVVFTVQASLWLLGIVAELDEGRETQTRLAVAEERLRFSRDVHDVLGRRLSTIAVQAELAATLAERSDDRAAARMLEVRGIAHDALAEARELARGYRPTDFRTELEGARSLLRSAGIEMHTAADDVPRGWHEAAGWVVREAVTNVLRHSAAERVDITYADDVLRVGNDGARPGDPGDGNGLTGLRERLGALGATLEAAGTDGRWTVTARLPGSGPLSATTATTPRPAEEAP